MRTGPRWSSLGPDSWARRRLSTYLTTVPMSCSRMTDGRAGPPKQA